MPAVTELIAEGINVNVTLLFSQNMHGRVVEAYMAGLERRSAADLPVAGIASVASFFVSRIDGAVDGILSQRLAAADELDDVTDRLLDEGVQLFVRAHDQLLMRLES